MIEQSIRIFRTAAATLNFTEAAAMLGMTQPNVTQQLAKLERELHVMLFVRNGRGVELTPAGRVLLEECEYLFSLESGILRKIRNAEAGKQSFALGGTMTAGSFLLIGMNAAFQHSHPDFSLDLKIDALPALQRRLAAGELELILTEEPYDRRHYLAEPYCTDRLIPVFAPGYMRGKTFSLGDYIRSGGRFILNSSGTGVHFAFTRFLREHDLPEPGAGTVTEAGGPEAVKQLVQSGAGVSILSELAVENELKAGILRTCPFSEGEIRRDVDFIYLPTGRQCFIQDFIRFCRRHKGLSLR